MQTEQNRTEQDRTEQNRAEQNRTEHNTTSHLLRNIFANSDVECILRAKTLQLNLTGEIG